MQTTTDNNYKARRINESYGRHEKATESEGQGTENGPSEFLIILDDQALFFAEEFLGEGGRGENLTRGRLLANKTTRKRKERKEEERETMNRQKRVALGLAYLATQEHEHRPQTHK